jgi:hypothetical protein
MDKFDGQWNIGAIERKENNDRGFDIAGFNAGTHNGIGGGLAEPLG